MNKYKTIQKAIDAVNKDGPGDYYVVPDIEPATGIENDFMLFWIFVALLVIGTAWILVPAKEWIAWLTQ